MDCSVDCVPPSAVDKAVRDDDAVDETTDKRRLNLYFEPFLRGTNEW